MKIEDSFQVDVPVDEAWKVLLDLERIAPCLPGAQLTEVEGDEYRGTVKIKVSKHFPLREATAAHRALEGRETTGSLVLDP